MTIVSRPVPRRRQSVNLRLPAIEEPKRRVLEAGVPLFREFLTEFRQDFGGWSPVTWRGLSGVLRNLEAEFGEVALSEITSREIDRYLSRRRREDGITAATCNRYLAALKTLYKQARIWGYVENLPTDALQMQKESSKVPDALSDDELERLLQHCAEPIHTIVALAADTGMRKSEIGRLCWSDLDLETGLITVRKTKNGRFRAIPMTTRLRKLLPALMSNPQTPEASVFASVDIARKLTAAPAPAGQRLPGTYGWTPGR